MTIDKTQAEAIAQAILEPDLQMQEELRRKREADARRLAFQRRVAAFALAGAGVGAAVGYFAFGQFSRGVIVGAILGFLVGRLIRREART